MKILNYCFLIILLVFSGCSDNGNEENMDQTVVLEFSVNGTPVTLNGYSVSDVYTSARKTSHHVHIGTDRNDTAFLISFDENGRFGKIVYKYNEPISGVTKIFTSFRDFSSNYFNFQLLSYDEENKRVKGTFSGNLYYDPLDLNSESKYISGSFDLPYKEYIPPVANLINQANINGVYWRSTNKYQTRDVGAIYHNITLHTLSDDPYKFMISFNDELGGTTLPGIYSFSNSDIIKKVQIAKYNVSTSSYTFYNCTGTLSITNIWNYCIQGTYNFTGVNPTDSSDIITVENGNFKLNYDPFN